MPSVNLPHPDHVDPEEFSTQVYRKLTEDNALTAASVDGVAADTDVSDLQDDVSDLQASIASFVSLDELNTILGLLRLVDLSDFIVKSSATGGSVELNRFIGFGWKQIGSWNMDSAASPSGWQYAADGDINIKGRSDILHLSTIIYNDSPGVNASTLSTEESIVQYTVSSTQIQLQRVSSGPFDNTGYNDTTINRGYYFIVYVPNP